MLSWANRFNIFLFLDSCNYKDAYSAEEWILAVDAINEFKDTADILNRFQAWLTKTNDWVFGNINYDLKNEIEPLTSSHIDNIQFPELYFFQPAIIIRKKNDGIEISSVSVSPSSVFEEIKKVSLTPNSANPCLTIQQRIQKDDYIQIINKLKQHILRGDCYEINFCQEFFAENAEISPVTVYQQLTQISPTPFAGFYKLNDKFLLCASPERFVQKKGKKIISQPIKGTIKRNITDAVVDNKLRQELISSQKDKSENVMVVDLVRNDLSKICKEDSVQAEELYGIYSFPQVHQMISTIVGELNEAADISSILKAIFPMGSMTGAPKLRVMQLIEQYEKTRRNIFSGSIGYITPDKDFDFNVVIRSIMYNSSRNYLCYQVGGGITFYSDPEKEYEECLLKAEAIKKVLQ